MKLLYLSALSFVFVASFAMTISGKIPTEIIYPFAPSFDRSSLPVLTKGASFPLVSAQGVIAIDEESAVILYEKNADARLLPASTTKIATALVALENYSLEETVKVGKLKLIGESQRMGLFEGEQITVGSLLDGLLIYSANDAAEALALNFSAGRPAFIAEMNRKAKEVGLTNTNFVNPTGLDEEGHVSTARDMARLGSYAMKNKTFAQIVGTKQKTVKSIDEKVSHHLKNINKLLGTVDGVNGVKTGWTENARENLITEVKRKDRTILIGLLGSQDRFGETKEIIEWIFSNYSWNNIPSYQKVAEKN